MNEDKNDEDRNGGGETAMSDFYVGYLPKAPPALARFLRRVVVALGLLAAVVVLLLVTGQMPFANSTFEYGKVRSFEGTIVLRPYPVLLVARPGQVVPSDARSEYLLVAPGKHGADDLAGSFDGRQVRLQGQLIYRDDKTMVELVPGSIVASGGAAADQEPLQDMGPTTVSGEIVDSKCYLGVMNPGQGKVHRDCAARCLSGGIPPIFVSAERVSAEGVSAERGEQYLLLDMNGNALGHDDLREFIAESVSVEGEVLERGKTLFLKIDPRALRHAASTIQAAR
jgi:hypothetical protein